LSGKHKKFDGGKDRKGNTMKKKHGVFLGIISIAMLGVSLSAQEGEGGKTSLTLDFSASVVSVNTDGDVDSLTDAGFGEDNESTFGFSYENEFFGGVASLGFGSVLMRFFDSETAELDTSPPLSIDELYVWAKPWGSHAKFTAGIFENMDGVADYSDDLDLFDMGVFITGEGYDLFAEPDELTNPSLSSGLLTDLIFGPVTLQFLLAPNYNKEKATGLFDGIFATMIPGLPSVDADARFFRLGGRASVDLGVATVSAMFKTYQWPMKVVNTVWGGVPPSPFPGDNVNYMAFGAYADITAIENLGFSFGYTGYTRANDASGIDNILFNGIDFRAAWTGIKGLSISTHHNFSFAMGAENDWMQELLDDDSFLALFNAVGVTKELTEKFSLNVELANLFSKIDSTLFGEVKYDNFTAGLKLITKMTEYAEFKVGLKCDVTNTFTSGVWGDVDDLVTTFSVPIGITVSF
jgi:hypothetical protein